MARAVSLTGQLGVVSGTAVDAVMTRRLQDGDPSGEIRRVLKQFPDQKCVTEVLSRYFIEGGKAEHASYLDTPKPSLTPSQFASQLVVLANFVEVALAKEGNSGLIGVNFLEKIQLATPASIFGAMIANVDYILMGAGIPSDIPQLIRDLLAEEKIHFKIKVEGADHPSLLIFDPHIIDGVDYESLKKPFFIAIVSSHILANYLARDEETMPDGFVIEGPTAGGHNAPPRSKESVGSDGQSVFGEKDQADLSKVAALGLPFWLAGGYGTPQKVKEAISLGATGVQVGSLFALTTESGITENLRNEVLSRVQSGTLEVRTEPHASSTGFPFKVIEINGTASEDSVYQGRTRQCDLGYLRIPYKRPDDGIGYRCSGEPTRTFVFKGGDIDATKDVRCLCNALMANIGLGQVRWGTYSEPALLTLGSDFSGIEELNAIHNHFWTSSQVVEYLLSESSGVSETSRSATEAVREEVQTPTR